MKSNAVIVSLLHLLRCKPKNNDNMKKATHKVSLLKACNGLLSGALALLGYLLRLIRNWRRDTFRIRHTVCQV